MRRHHTLRVGVLSCWLGFLWLPPMPAAAALSIDVVRGDGGNNNPATGRTVSPVIRVVDAGKPVSNALVIFSSPETGPSFEFDEGGRSANTTTGESGTAVAPSGRPVGGNGPMEIRVVANHGGQFANAVIREMNVGVNFDSSRTTELDVFEVPQTAEPGRPGRTLRSVVRVQDGNGMPVNGATVVFILRKLSSSGKVEKLAETTATSGANGEAAGVLPRQSANAHLECMIEANSAGRRVTEFLAIK